MAEEIQTQNEQKNTVATVGMRFSIIWLIALITILFARLWFPLLFLWFILWIIGLFYKPRGRARVAVIIPLVVFIAIASIVCYVWSSIKTPAKEFVDWAKIEFENIDEENYDNERFNAIINEEFNNISSSLNEEEFKSLLENGTWSNMLEKFSYVIFGLLQQGFEASLERYNNELPQIQNEELENDNDEIIEVEVNQPDEDADNIVANVETENVEIFTQSEQNDIEEILNFLE